MIKYRGGSSVSHCLSSGFMCRGKYNVDGFTAASPPFPCIHAFSITFSAGAPSPFVCLSYRPSSEPHPPPQPRRRDHGGICMERQPSNGTCEAMADCPSVSLKIKQLPDELFRCIWAALTTGSSLRNVASPVGIDPSTWPMPPIELSGAARKPFPNGVTSMTSETCRVEAEAPAVPPRRARI